MIIILFIAVLAVIIAFALSMSGDVSQSEIDEYFRSRPDNRPDSGKEKYSFREHYLHRNDEKHNRHKRNQWPL